MDPNISKTTTVKERVVTKCAESQTYGTISRWSDFHVPIHSAAFAMDKQFRRREMDDGIKKHLVRDGGFFEGSWGQGFQ